MAAVAAVERLQVLPQLQTEDLEVQKQAATLAFLQILQAGLRAFPLHCPLLVLLGFRVILEGLAVAVVAMSWQLLVRLAVLAVNPVAAAAVEARLTLALHLVLAVLAVLAWLSLSATNSKH